MHGACAVRVMNHKKAEDLSDACCILSIYALLNYYVQCKESSTSIYVKYQKDRKELMPSQITQYLHRNSVYILDNKSKPDR